MKNLIAFLLTTLQPQFKTKCKLPKNKHLQVVSSIVKRTYNQVTTTYNFSRFQMPMLV